MAEVRTLVVDVDGTLCPVKGDGERYEDLVPHPHMVERLRDWRAKGWRVVLYTARNMRTYDGQIGLINKHTAPVLLDWLERWRIPYDEIHFGKPWPGHTGFYVDDRCVRPDEFMALSPEQLEALIADARARFEAAREAAEAEA